LDALLSVYALQQVFGAEVLQKLTEFAVANARPQDGIKTVVFMAVIEGDENSGKGQYKGILPVDVSLNPILVKRQIV
jgi:hypothetical protein